MSIAAQAAKRTININDVPLNGKVVTFSYYESLLSPFVTANFSYIDTGNSVASTRIDDPQERLGTLRSALPLRGNEKVSFKFTTSLGSLEFNKYQLLVDGSILAGQESQREGVIIRLLSPSYNKNLETFVKEKYYNSISDSARKIISEKLKVPSDRIKLDKTKNPYAFTGSNRKPFDVLMDIAGKSVSPTGEPGYFVYETKSGMNFRSIDSLISQSPKATYVYNGVFKSDLKNDSNAFRILTQPIKKEQSISSSLKSGMYSALFRFMFEDDQVTREVLYKINANQNSLGKRTVEFNPQLAESPSRLYTVFVPKGMMEKGIKNIANNSPADYLARAVMRYNLLFVQTLDILVPCNPNLEAGDVIDCKFEKVTASSKSPGSTDIPQSGKYLILNLCHHYNTTNSYTSLSLVRDTYGRSGGVG